MPYYLTGNVTCYNDLYCPKLKEKNKKNNTLLCNYSYVHCLMFYNII